MTNFLINRSAMAGSTEGVTEQNIYGSSYHWLGVLFAILGSGAQYSAMPRDEREFTSQVYICCSFEFLRYTNFLSQPHVESIQALIVISNVMANNMNTRAAWNMLGMTIRLAQGLGLHRNYPPHVPNDVVLSRSKVWWAIVWQDSLLSIIYDQASTMSATYINTMPMPQHYAAISSYHATMYRLCKVGLDIVKDRAVAMDVNERYRRIGASLAISSLFRDAADYLRDSTNCAATLEALEGWALYLHSSFVLSELDRPAVSPNMANSYLAKAFRTHCVDNLINTVDAYLGLNNISSFARQSWEAMHRALRSGLLLGILGEHTRNERARRLIGRLVVVMTGTKNSSNPQDIDSGSARTQCFEIPKGS